MSASRSNTVGESIRAIHEALSDYIEATYHVGHPVLVQQRLELLDQHGVISQVPYIESTPRYRPGRRYSDLPLPPAALRILQLMSMAEGGSPALIHDPPYEHQEAALIETLAAGKSLVLTTGTGSGKTESFLLPIIARLFREAADNPQSFTTPAVRAIVLYPMNALVNDQLGRLRLLLGADRVVNAFVASGGRPARFARYTSRTLYPGVRTATRDSQRLKPLSDFYLSLIERSRSPVDTDRIAATRLVESLKARGKWPAKPDLRRWYGESGTKWQSASGQFQRAVMMPRDAELLTRHEVLATPPDVLVTNYSMLEYMLMRPLERPIFDLTRHWLADNPSERFMLVVDEAHLYRGAGGAEVGLLLRRLRSRLGLSQDRMQVICTSASFRDLDHARTFAAQLTGKTSEDIISLRGQLDFRVGAGKGSERDAAELAALSITDFYDAATEQERIDLVRPFLEYRAVGQIGSLAQSLYLALKDFPPMAALVNLTMEQAHRLDELPSELFVHSDGAVADRATSALIALGSIARPAEGSPGLLPARVHAFFRGLPGLWACVDPACGRSSGELAGPVGRLFPQPEDTCPVCHGRVFELFTCRHCGAAYIRGYIDDVETPNYLWAEAGVAFEAAGGAVDQLQPLDVCLEEPSISDVEPVELDLVTGRLNPRNLGPRSRVVFIKRDRRPSPDLTRQAGEFVPCAVCGQSAAFGRTSVQDHQTKGDQPFQALITEQLQVQPPTESYSEFAPLRGRKVLTFSDSRQTAARLAPNLQTYSLRDILRPLVLVGIRRLESSVVIAPNLSIDDIYLAVLIAASQLQVRLRPELKGGETMQGQLEVDRAVRGSQANDPNAIVGAWVMVRGQRPPQALLRELVEALTDRFYGFRALALASFRERRALTQELVAALSPLGEFVRSDAERLAFARWWLNEWANPGVWLGAMTPEWWNAPKGVRGHSGKFDSILSWLPAPALRKQFQQEWLPILLRTFCEQASDKYRMLAANLTLDLEPGWGYCQACRTTQRPFPGSTRCINCGRDRVTLVDPDHDPVFLARKGYYRSSAVRALAGNAEPPLSIIAAEHTAQLSAAQPEQVFSSAEEHELLFQDVDLGLDSNGRPRTAIDVLSCTTTMEVGIDIGTLSGVALRNMPPSRASYQQRAGRAGRRGSALASVIAFGSADSHDEHYFREPDAMIRGPVDDPTLTLDNPEIAKRHVTAYLLQRYHQSRLPDIAPEQQPALFEVMGTVDGFRDTRSILSRQGFERWLKEEAAQLREDLNDWLPSELTDADRQTILANFVSETLTAIDLALQRDGSTEKAIEQLADERARADAEDHVEAQPEVGDERQDPGKAVHNLLDRLLYKGVLPRYAFPTDVVAFHVFDRDHYSRFRPAFQYAPSQGLPVALTQYAPGKEVWIDGKLWQSGAIYSPLAEERSDAWNERRLYFECRVCHYARTNTLSEASRGDEIDCPACGSPRTFGKAKYWMIPPGFAHPVDVPEGTSPDDQPGRSYATRAKLVAGSPNDPAAWQDLSPRLRRTYDRTFLLVTNTGPRQEGYSYCTICGLVEPTAGATGRIAGSHRKPYPDDRQPECVGGRSTQGLVFGTDFISDVMLVSLRVDEPITLRPGLLSTQVALRSVSDALTIAATHCLDIDAGEIQAEFRPALTEGGHRGVEAEIYLYDTLSGGAGFSRRVAELGLRVFQDALKLLEHCPSECDHSCYRCLRSFRNRFEHTLLDRHVGAVLLRYLLTNELIDLSASRLTGAADRLAADLERHGAAGLNVVRQAHLRLPGIGDAQVPILLETPNQRLIVGIHGPMTPDFTSDQKLMAAKEFGAVPVVLVDEMLVTRNLPQATMQVLKQLR